MRRRWGAVHTFGAAPTFESCALAPEILGGPIIVAARVTADISFEIHLTCISYSTCSQPEPDDSIVSNHARPFAENPATPGQVHPKEPPQDPFLYLHRSWTGFCIYQVDFIREGGAWVPMRSTLYNCHAASS
jgi:hypothetical protein